jgi:hypothetical protein
MKERGKLYKNKQGEKRVKDQERNIKEQIATAFANTLYFYTTFDFRYQTILHCLFRFRFRFLFLFRSH